MTVAAQDCATCPVHNAANLTKLGVETTVIEPADPQKFAAAIRDETRPKALLGTFHCPWTDTERDGALRKKLGIDLKAQARYIDVFSPMPYHARFGYAKDPAWISRQTKWLGEFLGGGARIWPIVQLSDWGEKVPVEQVAAVLDHGTRAPATGVMVFAWGRLRKRPDKVAAMVESYRAMR